MRDAGGFRNDACAFPHDAGGSPHDADAIPHDAGVFPHDAGAFPHEAGAFPHSAGHISYAPCAISHDTDVMSHGAGVFPHDAGAVPHDAEVIARGLKIMIFISYARNDKDFVNRLCRELDARNASYWLDEKDILAGDSIAESIESGLREATFFFLCLSQASVNRPWVLREYRTALNLQLSLAEKTLKIVPLLIQPCEVPELLRDIRYADFSQDFTDGLHSLCKALKLPLAPSELPSAASGRSQEELNIMLFVGQNLRYYFSKWESMEASGRTVSFNWGAFFFTGLWMAYRKMYLSSVVFLLATSLVGSMAGFSAVLPVPMLCAGPRLSHLSASGIFLWMLVQFCIMLLSGLSANGFYLLHLQKKLTNIKLEGLSPIETQNLIRRVGGTSVGSVIGYYFLFGFLSNWWWFAIRSIEGR